MSGSGICAIPSRDTAEAALAWRPLAAGAIGNVLEWYDFGLYGFLAPTLGRLFFPSHDRIASLLGVFAGFAIGFLMRPLGGIVFGYLGDRIGRQFVLLLSVTMMGSATVLVGLLPTYAEAGVAAPVLLVLVRILQGVSVGGEFTGSVTYLVETAPENRRGFAGSFANIGSMGGSLLAAGLAALTAAVGGAHALDAGAWRIPFLAGGALAAIAFLLRRHIEDSPYRPDPNERIAPLRVAFAENPRGLGLATLFAFGYGGSFYLAMVFLPTFATSFGHTDAARALGINTIAQALTILVIPLAGWSTDRLIGRTTLIALAFAALALTAWPGFAAARDAASSGLWAVQIGFALLLALVMGAAPAMLSGLFPPRYRLSGYSLAFNLGMGFGGGTAPMIATALIGVTGSKLAAGVYLLATASLAAIASALLGKPSVSKGPKPRR
ncbi:MFS transporter [Acidiphilium sp. AL]|uniref:MFS transporter n=1 Tax=Acidiphilium iwatense TaxID=768198 RepID=A0ABS9DWZ8_9PROT|nr:MULTISPECIES: MFS transporter [Acidiphilium]MCF3946715.1 MFS transporter [Acidiphilium iwatense]MCU4158685.1 MFS transporter [Acidiphilium sp. AL]